MFLEMSGKTTQRCFHVSWFGNCLDMLSYIYIYIMFGFWLALYPRSNRLDGLQRLRRFVQGYMRDVQVSHVCLLTNQVSEETTK